MKTIHNWDGKIHGGLASHGHAEAMRIEDLAKIMAWSEEKVPLTSARSEQHIPKDLVAFLNHYMMCAFLSCGFTLWTRSVIVKLGFTGGDFPNPRAESDQYIDTKLCT